MQAKTVGPLSLGEMKNFIARRPPYTVLATEKYERLRGSAPRDWRDAVAEYVRDHYLGRNPGAAGAQAKLTIARPRG
jgi:hypothetical protein